MSKNKSDHKMILALKHAAKKKSGNHQKKGGATVNKGGVKMSAAPAAIGSEYQVSFKETRIQVKHKGKLRDAIRVQGQEYLGPVQVLPGEEPGSVYMEIYLSPGEFAGTRLSLYARLYEKFLFEEMDFDYLPAVGSEVPGQIVIAHDRDILDATPPSSQQGVRQFLAMEDARAGSCWKPITARCPLRSEEDGFFCNPVVGSDDRLAYQGQVYVACVVPSNLASGSTLGTLLLRYSCVFLIPQLENELNYGNIVVGNAEPAYPALSAANGVIDVLQWLASAPALQGLAQYIPKLQADGTYAITVPEGLYDYFVSFFNTFIVTGADPPTCSFEDVSVEALEPQPSPAPQPAVEPTFSSAQVLPASTSVLQTEGPSYRAYINIPRGGARLRQRIIVNGGTGTVSFTTPDLTGLFTRLGGVVQSLLSLLPSPSPDMVLRCPNTFGQTKGKKEALRWRTFASRTEKIKAKPDNARISTVEKAVPSLAFQDPLSSKDYTGYKMVSASVQVRSNEGNVVAVRDPCWYCGAMNPDHFGRNCSQKICEGCGCRAPGHNLQECPDLVEGRRYLAKMREREIADAKAAVDDAIESGRNSVEFAKAEQKVKALVKAYDNLKIAPEAPQDIEEVPRRLQALRTGTQ